MKWITKAKLLKRQGKGGVHQYFPPTSLHPEWRGNAKCAKRLYAVWEIWQPSWQKSVYFHRFVHNSVGLSSDILQNSHKICYFFDSESHNSNHLQLWATVLSFYMIWSAYTDFIVPRNDVYCLRWCSEGSYPLYGWVKTQEMGVITYCVGYWHGFVCAGEIKSVSEKFFKCLCIFRDKMFVWSDNNSFYGQTHTLYG